MPTAFVSGEEIAYTDTGGAGPVLVLLHGVTMDASLWRHVVPILRQDADLDLRCICPTLPLGSHTVPLRRRDLATHRGVATLVGELLEVLELRDVTLVLNDWGGAQLLLADGPTDRIAAAALVACEAFDNFPPGVPGRALARSARAPGLLRLTLELQRFRWFRRAPGAWGWMSKRAVPGPVMDRWFAPARLDAGVRRDLRRFATSTPSRQELADLPRRLARFDRPVLVVWASEDKLMPRAHGRRLAGLFRRGRLVEVDDSYTLVPEDQPVRLAAELVTFVTENVVR